jgi:glutaconate CoA-transferase subunit B
VRVVVTDLGILEPQDGELTLVATHPGVTVDDVREATGWDLRVAEDMQQTAAPTEDELRALRSLKTKGGGDVARP